jgi:hypothetical protein
MYRQRLQWLNTDSRRLFGVITEANVCLVIDCKQADMLQFKQYKNSLLKLINEQISQVSTFNIIICGEINLRIFKDQPVQSTDKTIDEAIDWINDWNSETVDASTDISTCNGVLKAFEYATSIDSVYLISENLSSNSLREILFDKAVKQSFKSRIQFNVIAFNCNDFDTVTYLRRLALACHGPGHFYAYCLLRQFDDYIPGPIVDDPTQMNVFKNRRIFGGAPAGSGAKQESMFIFNEIQAAQESLDHLNIIIETMQKEANLTCNNCTN